MLTAGVVGAGAQAILCGYVATALMRGAKSVARRDFGRVFAAYCIYSVLTMLGYSSRPPARDLFFAACLLAGLASTMLLLRFVRRIGAKDLKRPLGPPWFLGSWIAIALVVVGHDAYVALRGASTDFDEAVFGTMLLVVFVALIVVLVTKSFGRGAERGEARAYLFAVLCPLVPLVYSIVLDLGWVDGTFYGVVRNLFLLLYVYALLAAYLDYADEQTSLRVRFTAATLAVVLATLGVVCEMFLRRKEATLLDGVLVLGLTVVASVFVIGFFPRFYRRSVIAPLEQLVLAMQRFERGERDLALAVAYDDEIGYVTASLNDLVGSLRTAEGDLAAKLAELQSKNEEVRGLNDDLRQQIVARSRELADALARANPASNAIAEGDVVDQKYRVGAVLGAGGMGTVYAVTRVRDQKPFALKVMQSATSEAVNRFAREMQIAAGLDHENVVSIVDIGVWRGGAYIVMELVEGGSLEDCRDRFGDVAWGLEVLAQMARALEALHDRGIVHRDLKPANVLIARASGDGLQIKITDFGIAVQSLDVLGSTVGAKGGSGARLTATGALIGTLPYMAPELLHGGGRVAGTPADIFAFGLIAYELLTGTPAFEAPAVFIAVRGLPSPAPLPDGVPKAVSAMLRNCLSASPQERPTAHMLVDALRVERAAAAR